MAIPLFIFAATVCRYIGDKRYNPNYLPILSQLFDDENEVDKEKWISEFRDIVGGIVVLNSPLSIVSLSHLFGILKEDISCQLDLLHSVLSIPVNEDIPIRLLHLSFRDFLLDPQKQGKSPFWVNERETHRRLASKCLQLMSSSNGLRQNMCKLSNSGILRSEIEKQTIDCCLQPEIQYACRYWVHHLEQSKDRIVDGDPAYTFLQKCFLYWLEAMSLIGQAPESIHMINRLQLLVNVRNLSLESFNWVLTYWLNSRIEVPRY